jgi:hypothetical protein
MQSGKQCLCRYTLPNELGKGFFSNHELNSDISDTYSDLKITSIADAVEGRINVTCSNGLVRCPCTLSLCVLVYSTYYWFITVFAPFFLTTMPSAKGVICWGCVLVLCSASALCLLCSFLIILYGL